jgi:hypothetical protein
MYESMFVASRFLVDQRAGLPIRSFAPGGAGDLGRKEIAPGSARRFRDAAPEFTALAVLVDVAADGQAPVFAPERLEQTGSGPKPRIERLVDAMFLENVGRDNGWRW